MLLTGGTQGNDLGHSNNVLDWAIRSQVLTSCLGKELDAVHRLNVGG